MNGLVTELALVDVSASVLEFAINWLLQSTLLIGGGLVLSELLRRSGSAIQSVLYRTTLVAELVCPLATWVLSQVGVSGWSIAIADDWFVVEDKSSEPGTLSLAAEARLIINENDYSGDLQVQGNQADNAEYLELKEPGSLVVNDATLTVAGGVNSEPPSSSSAADTIESRPTLLGYAGIAIVACWLVVSIYFAARLVNAFRRLGGLRRGAIEAEESTLEACRELSTPLGVTPPEVLRSPLLPSPCLAGLRRPAVLLPESDLGLSLREVLIHELAHLRRHDCHWNLLRQVATSLYFFQPLLWVLSRRVEATAEEVCDDYVVQLGGDRHEYAHQLVDIAELSTTPIAVAGVGIVSLRSMLAKRVTRILDTSRVLSTRVGNLLLVVVLLGGFVGAGIVGLVGIHPKESLAEVEVEAAELEDEEDVAGSTEGIEEEDTITVPRKSDDLITVRGTVVDPSGKPLPHADVAALRWYWDAGDPKPLAEVKADDAGRFEISYRKSQFFEDAGRPDQWREAYFTAFAEGFGPGWVLYEDLDPGQEAVVRLAVDDVPIEGRIVDLEGKGVAGATIEMGYLNAPKGENLDEWLAAVRGGQSIMMAARFLDGGVPLFSAGRWRGIVTDAEGRFTMSGIGRERQVKIHVKHPTIVTETLAVVTRRMESISHPAYDYEDSDTEIEYGAEFEYAAATSRPYEGIVTDAKTGEPIAGAEVWSYKFSGTTISGIHTIKIKTDENGRYRLEGMPKGGGNEIVVVPTDLPYFTAEFELPDPPGLEPAQFDFQLHRGVWVSGRVADGKTGAPVSARMHYIAPPDNVYAPDLPEFEYGTHVMSVQDRYHTDPNGKYRVVALPGRAVIGVNVISRGYPTGQGHEKIADHDDKDGYTKFNGVFDPSERSPTAVKEIQVPEEGDEVTCDFVLDAGLRVALHVTDPAGKPLTEVAVDGSRGLSDTYQTMPQSEFEIAAMRADETRTVLLHHKERGLGKALHVKAAESSKDPLEVRLDPCAIVIGRLTKDGEPVGGAMLRFDIWQDGDYGQELARVSTDDDGHFVHKEVLPGLPYEIFAEGAKMDFVIVAEKLEVAPGETIDLGTIDIATEERPEPVRSLGIATTDSDRIDVPGTGGSEVATPQDPVEETPLGNDSRVASRETSAKPRLYSGRVETPQGEPIAGAKIWLAATSHQYTLVANRDNSAGLLRELGTTDEQGRFEVVLDAVTTQEIRKRFNSLQTQLVASAPGHGLDWMPLDVFEVNSAPSENRDALQAKIDKALGDGRFASRTLKLRPESQPVRGRLVDLEGHRLPNVTVLVENLMQPDTPRLLKAFEMSWKREVNEAFDATSFGVGGLARSELQKLFPPVTTDENGEFELRGIGNDQLLTLVFDADRVEARPVHVLGREMKTVNLPHIDSNPGGAKDVFVGRDFTYALGPSVPVEGVVTDYDTGEPVAGVLVYVERLFKEHRDHLRLDTHHMQSVTDEKGRFRITGMPPGEGHLLEVVLPKSEPYLPVLQVVSLSLEDGDAKRIDFQVKRGIWIEGRITDKQSGEPLAATVGYLALKKNPHALDKLGLKLAWDEDRYRTDSDGRYRVLGLPGPGVLLVRSQSPKSYPLVDGAETIDGYDASRGAIPTTPGPMRVSDWHLLKQINPAADAGSFASDLELDAGDSIPGRAVGPDGKPTSNLYVLGQTEGDVWWRPRWNDNFRLTDRFAVYGYDGKGPRQLFFKNEDDTLVGQYRLEGDAPEEIAVTLQPSVRVTGRVIDSATDLPAARCFVSCERCLLFNGKYPPVNFRTPWCFTDDEGRFEMTGLMAGHAYEMDARSDTPSPNRNRFMIDLTDAKPGDVIELGDVTEPKPAKRN